MSHIYMYDKGGWRATVVDTSVDQTVIHTGPAYLARMFVNTVLSAHAVVFSDGATSVFTTAVSVAAGGGNTFDGTLFKTSLVVNPDVSSTGNITVVWAPA